MKAQILLPFVAAILPLLTHLVRPVSAVEMSLTILLPAAKKECFYHHSKAEVNMEFEYQVIHGGELDIDVEVMSHQNQVLVRAFKKPMGNYRFQAPVEGDYSFCFDNNYSSYAEKMIFFDVLTDEPASAEAIEAQPEVKQREMIEAYVNMTVEQVRTALDKIRSHLDRSEQAQRLFSAIELKDRSIAEDNFERVNFWSVVFVVVMVIVAVVQVVMIRSLFSDKNSKRGFRLTT